MHMHTLSPTWASLSYCCHAHHHHQCVWWGGRIAIFIVHHHQDVFFGVSGNLLFYHQDPSPPPPHSHPPWLLPSRSCAAEGLLSHKAHRNLVQPYEQRSAAAVELIRAIRPTLHITVGALVDPMVSRTRRFCPTLYSLPPPLPLPAWQRACLPLVHLPPHSSFVPPVLPPGRSDRCLEWHLHLPCTLV